MFSTARHGDTNRRRAEGAWHEATVLLLACASEHTALAAHLRAAGGCRFALDTAGKHPRWTTPPRRCSKPWRLGLATGSAGATVVTRGW